MNAAHAAERRRFPRFPFHSRAVLRLDGAVVEGMLLDISYNGALFEPAQFAAGSPEEECVLTVVNDGGRRQGVDIVGRVAYRGGCTIGIQFHPLEWLELAGLMRIIELNLGTQEMLSRQLGRLLADSGHPTR